MSDLDSRENLNPRRYRLSQEPYRPAEQESESLSISEDEGHELNLAPEYQHDELFGSLYKFIQDEKVYRAGYFERKLRELSETLQIFNKNRQDNILGPLKIDYLEHAHYIYSFKAERGLTQEEIKKVEYRESKFSDFDYPDENMYKYILKLLKFLSRLMVRFGIFDINQYGYRFKGRSLTVKLLDMRKINKQCLSADIFWFSYAIRHKPFIGKIEKILKNYAKILQHSINQMFDFLDLCTKPDIDGEPNIYYINFENYTLNAISRWRRWIFREKMHPATVRLYEISKSIEISYRYFEKHLIQEFLKII